MLDLRTLLPQRLWDPILATIRSSSGSKPRSREALFTHLKKTADDGFREMENFRTTWHSPEMHDLWEKTKVESFPQGSDTWRVNYRTPQAQPKEQKEGTSASVDRLDATEEDVKGLVGEFKAQHPAIKLEVADEATLWPLTIRVSSMQFQIGKGSNEDTSRYRIHAKPGVKTGKVPEIQQEILKAMKDRKMNDSLSYLLVSQTKRLSIYH